MKKQFMALLIALFLCMALSAGSASPELVELSCGKVEYLNYRCTLPDGRLLLTGGTRRDETGGDAAWIVCLNTDRTVSWEYFGRKDGYTSAENAVVLQDGTVAVLVEDYPEKRAVMFFTPDGKKARKKLDLKKIPGNVYMFRPSVLMIYDAESNGAGNYDYTTALYDWNGKKILEYGGLIVKGGYGFEVGNEEDLVLYGMDSLDTPRAMIQKLDWQQDKILWQTVLDLQQPGSDSATIDEGMKTGDGGYLAWLREGRPGETEDDPWIWDYILVKFDAQGRLRWTQKKAEYGQHGGQLLLYGGKTGVFCTQSSRIEDAACIRWLDDDGNELGITELALDLRDFKVLRNYLEPEDPEDKRTTILDQVQFIPMEDGLWAMATCWVAHDFGDDGFSTIFDSQEIVFFRVPVL